MKAFITQANQHRIIKRLPDEFETEFNYDIEHTDYETYNVRMYFHESNAEGNFDLYIGETTTKANAEYMIKNDFSQIIFNIAEFYDVPPTVVKFEDNKGILWRQSRKGNLINMDTNEKYN